MSSDDAPDESEPDVLRFSASVQQSLGDVDYATRQLESLETAAVRSFLKGAKKLSLLREVHAVAECSQQASYTLSQLYDVWPAFARMFRIEMYASKRRELSFVERLGGLFDSPEKSPAVKLFLKTEQHVDQAYNGTCFTAMTLYIPYGSRGGLRPYVIRRGGYSETDTRTRILLHVAGELAVIESMESFGAYIAEMTDG